MPSLTADMIFDWPQGVDIVGDGAAVGVAQVFVAVFHRFAH